jgi:hypothetical protein
MPIWILYGIMRTALKHKKYNRYIHGEFSGEARVI